MLGIGYRIFKAVQTLSEYTLMIAGAALAIAGCSEQEPRSREADDSKSQAEMTAEQRANYERELAAHRALQGVVSGKTKSGKRATKATGGSDKVKKPAERPRIGGDTGNPADKKCAKDGHRVEGRKGKDGGEYSVCISGSGKECNSWAYFRGECSLD